MRNFNEIFRRGVTYDNFKSHKKQGFTLSLKDMFFKKPHGWGQIDPPSCFRVKFNLGDNILELCSFLENFILTTSKVVFDIQHKKTKFVIAVMKIKLHSRRKSKQL